tara:strand:- start:223 stop:1647 length:1425 start_codon:yes stop_codon:yes gene_type:complete
MSINFEQSIFLPDNNKIILGNQPGGDLQIYHDGSNSYIDDAGAGTLNIRSNIVSVQKYTGETLFRGTADGSFEAFNDNSKKLETTASGVSITGGVTTSSSSSLAGANMTAGIAMGTNSITGMANPSAAQDASTKSYVDTQISGVPQGTVTSVATGTGLTGGTITSSGTISVDSSVVLTNNTQTISGAKTISDTLTMSADIDFESSNAAILMGASSTFQIDGDPGVGKYLKSVSGGLEWAAVTTGTVTSVGITAGAGISVSNSPITSSGNITVTNTITNNNQLTNGRGFTTNTGTVTSIATTSPITGGTITGSGTIAFDSTAVTSLANLNTTGTVVDGVWNSNTQLTKTSSTSMDYQGEVVYLASSTVVKGKVYVYSGGDWVAADADSATTASGTLAVALNNGTSSTVGMLTRGMFTGQDLGDDGNLLYLSTSAGSLTIEPPSGSGDIVRIVGQLIDSTNGQTFFNPDYTFITLS